MSERIIVSFDLESNKTNLAIVLFVYTDINKIQKGNIA